MIETQDLTKWFGAFRAVDALSLQVGDGRVVGFLGPNGAGKSTTLRMISGFLPPSSGRAVVAGHDVRSESQQVRKVIGYLPESTPLYPEMRVIEYMRFRSRLYGLTGKPRRKAIEYVLERCWLRDVRRKPVGHLSKGYRQRVGLAAALLHNPKVLLLDEPTSGLDPSQIREMRGLIRELAGDHTIFLSTHILPEVEMTCDDVVVIARGSVRAQGTIDDLKSGSDAAARYIIEADSPALQSIFEQLDGVTDVSMSRVDDRWQRYELVSRESAPDLREMIAARMAAESIMIREIRREVPSLEQIFIRLTSDVGNASSSELAALPSAARRTQEAA